MHRVFITGVGVVTPVGNDKNTFWRSLLEGRSGVRSLQFTDCTDLAITIGGEVDGLDQTLAEVNDKVAARRMDRASLFSVIASREALSDAGFPLADLGDRFGVVVGAGLSGIHTLQIQTENLLTKGPRGVSPLTIPTLMPNASPANISLAFGITGTAYEVASACSSSGHAMIDAFEILRRGEADVVVAGGTESAMTRLGISAFANMKAMTKKYNDRPTEASRPFDADRDGFVMSEGAAMLVFETEESLKKRGGKAYAEMLGYGSAMDAYNLVQPDPSARGAIKAIGRAVEKAGWSPSDVAHLTYVNAHGTSTKFNDAAETKAIKEVFGKSAYKLQVSSTKSITGHMIGAACSAEMVACVLALTEGILPPTINYHTPDPECDLDYIPNKARKSAVEFAVNNSFGFGGHNVSLTIRRAENSR